jgi:hypothetical protein
MLWYLKIVTSIILCFCMISVGHRMPFLTLSLLLDAHGCHTAPVPGTSDVHMRYHNLSSLAGLNWLAVQFGFFLLHWHLD